ncbi:hypothetical protein ncot_12750 [Nocardioides sp. JQ2195]|uniref:hypothetical protein n=1 Tax=Nocardioides sp. JQ2195 TaxID=2592334 RepID=UPI00143EA6FF|nr:hypothetical protein [Nocardioides sp. JQ2195]QIX27373.1 hypothetical protein ncot_12750 [Nocardioides sp. JQ2195]
MRLRLLLPVVAAFAALTLTGCEGTSSASGGTVGEPATPSGSPSSEATAAPVAPDPAPPSVTRPPPPAAGAGATAPGTVLSYGDPAVVEVYASGNPKAQVEYTVKGVKMAGSGQGFGETALITIEVRAIDDLEDALALALIDWSGLDENGNQTVFGIADGCDDELPVEKAGETGTMCVAVALTDDGTSISEVHYDSGAYRGNPIVWRP